MRGWMVLIAAATLAVPAASVPLWSAAARQAAPAKFDAKAVVAEVRRVLGANYVVRERRPALDAVLAKGLESGRYSVSDPGELTRLINEDLAGVAHDKHLSMNFSPDFAAQLGAAPLRDDGPPPAAFFDQARRGNHGISKLEVLPGNIRVMRYDGFAWIGEESEAAIDNAMAFLRGGDAIVIDLRGNGGGSPDAVRRIASYFVAPGVKLVTFHMRSDPPTESHADLEVPGGRITGKPVYVLTSGHTASAAEEFASHVAFRKFGTLVGETTAGAGYRNEFFPLPGGFVISVSVGRPEMPDGSDWEGKGVAPVISVKEDAALARAQREALTAMAATAQGQRKTELEWAAAILTAKADPVAPALAPAAYAGGYGVRRVTLDGSELIYQREGGPKVHLTPLGGDLFGFDLDPNTHIRFQTADGKVTGLVIERVDGSSTSAPRD